MKKLFTLCMAIMPIVFYSQSTPSQEQYDAHPMEAIAGDRDFGDTITFNEQVTGAVITDQYALSHGAKFSGWPSPYYADVYDYTGGYGPIIKSSSWFDGVRIDFVNPADTSEYLPICRFGYNNPIDTELDYIITRMYDANGTLIHTQTDVSPGDVVIELENTACAYATFEDDFGSAYVMDNIWFETGDCFVKVNESTAGVTAIVVYPNPADNVIAIDALGNDIATLNLVDVTGRVVMNIAMNNAEKMQVDIAALSTGLYQLIDAKGVAVVRLVVE